MYRVSDLFAGAGGFSTGMRMAGFHTSLSLDFEQDAVDTFKANHPVGNLISWKASAEIFTATALGFANGIDVVVGGPPCQAFSDAGRKDPLDKRARLFEHYVRLLKIADRQCAGPYAFVFENVEGLARRRSGNDLREIQKALAGCGYHLSTRVLDASEFGVPQRRRRLIIVGSRFPGFRFPQPIAIEERKTLRDAIGDLPPPTETGEVEIDGRIVTGHKIINHSPEVLRLISRIPEGGRLYDLHLPDAPKAFRGSYARLAWDRPSQTITRSFSKPSSARCIHPEQHRGLTIREAARLQSFPDDFVFHGTDESVRLQIGNAVPPAARHAYRFGRSGSPRGERRSAYRTEDRRQHADCARGFAVVLQGKARCGL
ncbi:DNA (cytosine-5)-methyltransferase 1 [Rhizobium sp. PP-CC-2G-626]|nr:DNA (cytosine-5)-methyltransferase 1 [Rhizobium sp. PP-CC-2G-626]